MAIQVTRTSYNSEAPHEAIKTVTTKYVGRVLEVVETVERRNMSDTLDYTDFRDVNCVRALVWLGERGHRPMNYGRAYVNDLVEFGKEVVDLLPHEQFAWIDCSNHFAWRGADFLVPTVDSVTDPTTEPLMWVNYIAWQGFRKAEAIRASEVEAKHAAEAAAAKAKVDAEIARKAALQPKLGDKCKVVSGRKVPKGTMGIVAYMNDHSVLIKAEHEWRNRQANGTWVSKNHVERV